MDELPWEIIIDILSRLPIKSLLRCRCVCKSWLNFSHDSRLVDRHIFWSSQNETNFGLILKSSVPIHRTCFHSKLSFVENDGSNDYACVDINFSLPYFRNYEVMGSCNGLLCLFDPLLKHLTHIFNPCTGEYMLFPNSMRTLEIPIDVVVGFGYSSRSKEYKVVEIVYYSNLFGDDLQSNVHVYTVGDSSWRHIGDASFSLRGKCTSEVFVNGALHWVSGDYDGPRLVDCIVAFDVADEVFKIIPHPDFESGRLNYTLGALKGCLSSTNYKFQDYVEIWVMNSYGVKKTWTRYFKIICSEVGLIIGSVQPLHLQKNGEVLLLFGGTLLSYNPITRRLRELRISRLPRSFKAFAHVGSLVSPRRLFEK